MVDDEKTKLLKSKDSDEVILKEIRDNYAYYLDSWREIREEARVDMRYVAGQPWEPKDKEFREANGRPCMTWDELNPYINQLINDPRQNKRAVKVDPVGSGANDKTAELRGNIIRTIEYNSKAQSAYTTAFQGAAERSYGYWRIGKRYVTVTGKDPGPQTFNQELYIGRIPNPDTVLFDPNFKEVDCSDAMGCFVTDIVRKPDFKRKWPNAEITSFDGDQQEFAPQWIKEKDVMVAEYWRVTIEKKTLHLIEGKQGPTALFEDELPTGFDMSRSSKRREIEKRIVTQYITNGIEILDREVIEIPWIPIIPVFGKELYVDSGAGSKRMLISLVRMARDPFMQYCYYRSQEAEEAGLTPKVPYLALSGSIESTKEEWQSANKIPRAVLQFDPVQLPDGTWHVQAPERQPFTPNFQAYEVACEAARRAIQTAMSGSNLPTAAQRQNQKSGKALEEIDQQESRGTFHFIDNYNFAIEHSGKILDAWIPYVYDTKRELGLKKADGKSDLYKINDPDNVDQEGKPEVWDATVGEHSVTISVGPSYDSQRKEASEFVDTLIGNIQVIASIIPPGVAAKILSLAITLKELGPLGDEMANEISPPQDQQAQQQAIAAGQQKLQQQQEVIVEMQKELEKLQLEKAGKVIQGETQKQLATINNDVKVLIAEINTQQQNMQQRMEMFMQYWSETHGAAHEQAMQAHQQEHDKSQAMQQVAAQSAQSSQDHGQALEQQDAAQPPEGAQ